MHAFDFTAGIGDMSPGDFEVSPRGWRIDWAARCEKSGEHELGRFGSIQVAGKRDAQA